MLLQVGWQILGGPGVQLLDVCGPVDGFAEATVQVAAAASSRCGACACRPGLPALFCC
jgi:hypothetical protein